MPPGQLRDLRGLMRTRLALRSHTTCVKNRIHAAIRRYGTLDGEPLSDLFAKKSRLRLSMAIGRMPEETRRATLHEWELLDELERHIGELEARSRERIGCIGWVRLLKSLPGVGEILGATIHLEIGDVKRFATARHLASYAGLVPTVHASGGRFHQGPTSRQANHYLRWAFVEAANCAIMHKHRYADQHVIQLYQRLKSKCHGKAAVAVARHLSEANWWILSKREKYRQPHAAAMFFVQERVSAASRSSPWRLCV